MTTAKNEAAKESLRRNFVEVFALSAAAIDWLLMMWDISQAFDDVVDGMVMTGRDYDALIFNSLVGIQVQPFYAEHQSILRPLVALCILKWKGSDIAERQGSASAKSYMWRAAYYDLVLMALNLCHGPATAMENAHRVMDLYGETFADYEKEFSLCRTRLAV